MPERTPRLELPMIQQSQAQKHVTHNEALALLDVIVQLTVQGFGVNTPPGNPPDGQVWALGSAPTGAWSGQALKLAVRLNGGWEFIAPQEGWRAVGLVDGSLRRWSGSEWLQPTLNSDNLPGVGVNTTHDSTNRLTVSAPATLLNHEGAGHQLKINKDSASDTASLLFQTGFSGRAEMGTAGNDDWSIQVSPDGTTWHEALTLNRANGNATLKSVQAAAVTGTAVTQSANDTTAGRLMKVGDWGLGAQAAALPSGNDLNNATRMGWYDIDGATANSPLGGQNGVCMVFARGTTRVHQTAYRIAGGSVPEFYSRIAYSSGPVLWSPWTRTVQQQNLLGTVSQSGGVPTGAVLQHGSNANGQFLRLADGTQLCWHSVVTTPTSTAEGSLYKNPSDNTWTFPAVFAAAPRFFSNGIRGGAVIAGVFTADAPTTTAASFRAWCSSSVANVTAELLAIGRWY